MTSSAQFDELRLLLPFYANGTLDDARRVEVEAALTASAELRRELDVVRGLHEQVQLGGAALAADDARTDAHAEERLSAVMERLPQPPGSSPLPGSRTSRLSAALAFLTPRRWVPAVALSLVAVVGAQAVALNRSNARSDDLGRQLSDMTEKYQSASGPCEDKAAAGRIALEIKDSANWAAVADLLDSEKLTITDSGGFGTLTVASEAKGAALNAQIARLGQSAVVTSAALAQ